MKYDYFIEVGMSQFHFTPIDTNLDYSNWGNTSMDVNPIPGFMSGTYCWNSYCPV